VKPENGGSPVLRQGMRPAAAPGEATLPTRAQAEVRSWPVLAIPAPGRGDTRSGRRFLPMACAGGSALTIGEYDDTLGLV
jgi:hypothetical protein